MTAKTKPARSKAGESQVDTLDPRIVKAVSHPLRHRVLSRLSEGVASPKEMAREFGEPLPRLSYHVNVLREIGCLELVDTAKRRGATEHYYRALMRPFFSDDDWGKLPAPAQTGIIGQHVARIFDDVGAAMESGGFEATHTHVSWLPLDLDEEGLAEVTDLLANALDRLMEIHAESAGRQIERGAGEPASIATEVAILHFDRPAGVA